MFLKHIELSSKPAETDLLNVNIIYSYNPPRGIVIPKRTNPSCAGKRKGRKRGGNKKQDKGYCSKSAGRNARAGPSSMRGVSSFLQQDNALQGFLIVSKATRSWCTWIQNQATDWSCVAVAVWIQYKPMTPIIGLDWVMFGWMSISSICQL